MGEKLVLYIGEKNISSWSMRAHMMLTLKGLEFEERVIPLLEDRDRAQRRRVSLTGRVPVLVHGGLTIPDTMAILEYLEETFPPPEHRALWPTEPKERAHARWLAAAMHAGFAELRESMSFNLCFLPRPPRASRKARDEAKEMLGYWEDALGRKTEAGEFLFGPFGGVDAMYAPAVVRLKAFKIPTDDVPRAGEYIRAVLAHPAVRRWMDEAEALEPVAEE